jgi:hypothetical protein
VSVNVTTSVPHRLSDGDYIYIEGTVNYSQGVARQITITGLRTFRYTDDTDETKPNETTGTSQRGVDLSNAEAIRFIARSTGTQSQFLITGDALADADQNANRGRGSYTWVEGDTENIGTYNVEFEVDWGGLSARIETFPDSGYRELSITDDLA